MPAPDNCKKIGVSGKFSIEILKPIFWAKLKGRFYFF